MNHIMHLLTDTGSVANNFFIFQYLIYGYYQSAVNILQLKLHIRTFFIFICRVSYVYQFYTNIISAIICIRLIPTNMKLYCTYTVFINVQRTTRRSFRRSIFITHQQFYFFPGFEMEEIIKSVAKIVKGGKNHIILSVIKVIIDF